MSSDLPKNFTHLFQSKLFLQGMSGDLHYSVVGEEGSLGRRYTIGPFAVEYYTCDSEPKLQPFRGLRFVIWNPVTRIDIPKKWFRMPKESDHTVSVFLDIRNKADYYKTWSPTFRNYYNRYTTQSTYRIIKATLKEYVDMYRLFAKKDITVEKNIQQITRLTEIDTSATHFYFLQRIDSSEIVGGIAVVDCASVKQSYYLLAFTRKDIAPKETGLWLCDYWMKESMQRNISFANLGLIWTPGYPKDWKGFSDFKLKFNPIHIMLKRECIRFTFSLR
jgi:hypothetical protein